MDLEEWELLPDDGFLEIHDDGGKKIFSRKYVSDPENVFEMNYFICPSPKSSKFVESTEHSRVPKQLLPVPIHLDPTIEKTSDHEVVKEINKVPIEISIIQSAISEKVLAPNIGPVQADQDTISQVFFKKMKENEFVDMKVDSPWSNNSKGIMPQVDPGTFQFENKEETNKDEALESKNSFPEMENDEEIVVIKKNNTDLDIKDEATWEENSGGLNIWKWSLSGIGAICSFGVAAATVCIIVFGGRQKNKQHHQQAHKLQFHIYTDDKRIKQVVHQATRLNEAISAVRGVPITRAHFTIGGYYDGF